MNTKLTAFKPGRTVPVDIGVLHFVGIGGIGMSGIAEILHNLGYQVRGSDVAENANVARLRTKGIPVVIGHRPENVNGAAAVIKSTAVKEDNPEIVEARKQHIPVVRRSEMLTELMRLKRAIAVAGTHGKTTTTSLMAALLDEAGLDPTVINGGIINSYDSNARFGQGDWMVVEADESDGTFLKIPSQVAVVTNIDPEHLDFFGSFDAVKDAFRSFVQNLPFYGFGVMCIDHPVVQSLVAQISDRRILTYGLSPQADVRATNISAEVGGSVYDVVIALRGEEQHRIEKLKLSIPGEHNVQNSLAVIAVAYELGMPDAAIRKALSGFKGVKRRFTKTGEAGGITVIDDYGHHPVEIAATLKAARQFSAPSGGRVIAVVQPHRFMRLRDLFDQFCTCFNDADAVLVADVYTAGEEPIEGIHRDALVKGLIAAGHKQAEALESREKLAEQVLNIARPGDLVVCLGAGNITAWAAALPEELAAQLKKSKKAAS